MDLELESVKECQLCGSTKFDRRSELPDRLYGIPGRFWICRCADCGITFVNPRPSSRHIHRFYPGNYAEHQDPPPARLRWWEEKKGRPGENPGFWTRHWIRIVENSTYRAIPPFLGAGRALDIGCGNGEFLGKLKLLGWKTFGLERNPEAAEIARRGGHQVAAADLADPLPFADGSFDLVYCWHVIEHLHSPLSTMREAHRVLAPNGQLMLAAPNLNSFQALLFGSFWSKLELPRHLFHFSRKTLRSLLSEAGFNSIRIKTRTGATSYCRSFRLLLNHILGTHFQRDPSWAVSMFEIPLFVASLFGFFGLGSDLRVICRKA